MLDPVSFVRAFAFAVFYAGIEFRYVNRRDEEWTKTMEGFFERPAFWKVSPYQAFMLFPVFVIVGSALPVTAWAGNTMMIMVVEDIAYFTWRRRGVEVGEWTTTLFGSFRAGRFVVPNWWGPAIAVAVALYLIPF